MMTDSVEKITPPNGDETYIDIETESDDETKTESTAEKSDEESPALYFDDEQNKLKQSNLQFNLYKHALSKIFLQTYSLRYDASRCKYLDYDPRLSGLIKNYYRNGASSEQMNDYFSCPAAKPQAFAKSSIAYDFFGLPTVPRLNAENKYEKQSAFNVFKNFIGWQDIRKDDDEKPLSYLQNFLFAPIAGSYHSIIMVAKTVYNVTNLATKLLPKIILNLCLGKLLQKIDETTVGKEDKITSLENTQPNDEITVVKKDKSNGFADTQPTTEEKNVMQDYYMRNRNRNMTSILNNILKNCPSNIDKYHASEQVTEQTLLPIPQILYSTEHTVSGDGAPVRKRKK